MAIWGSWSTGKPGGTIGSHQKGVISRESNSIAMKSRVMGDCQARFRERLEVQFLRPTRQRSRPPGMSRVSEGVPASYATRQSRTKLRKAAQEREPSKR